VSNEAAVLADGPTPDWQPGAAQGGVPKAAIGALGAAMVGGVALAIVLLAPSNKATRPVVPEPIAQAAAQTGDGQKSVVTPPADVQTPAMRETPQASTVTPSSPAPVTDQPTPDTPATAPAH
jgi:hypothetical protein